MEIHRTLGDKVRIFRRVEGGAWHCSTYMKGKEWRKSTKEKSLARAKDVAEDWYLELCAKDRFGDGTSANKLLSGFNAPLGTFSSRIEAAYALGLISDQEYQDCTVIRKIRNEFAHTLSVSFADHKIIDRCRALHFSAKDYDDVVVPPRGQFSSAATALILNLTNRPHYVSKKRLSWQPWPY